jgi:hypothetical protein
MIFAFQSFGFSVFSTKFGDHRYKDSHQLTGFTQEACQLFADDAAVVSQQLEPQLAFIRLLEKPVQLGAEF